MKKCTASLLAFLLICAGCKQQVKSAAFDDERIARSWEEMVAIHDDVMPEMSDINRLKRQLRKDSTQLELIIKLTDYDMADDYFSTALVDTNAPGGFNHSGLLILVDARRHVRAFCDGTSEEAVDRFMEDIDQLLRQEYSQ